MKQQILSFLLILMPLVANAYTAEIDGVYYNFNNSTRTAEVTCRSSFSDENQYAYSGEVDIPGSVKYNGAWYNVTAIGEQAFASCSGITKVSIPLSVTSIGYLAFKNCTGLTTLKIPDSVTSIDDTAFYNCSGLTSVTMSNNLTTIGVSAFWGCSSLTSVIIPQTVTSIGDHAFEGCSSLTSVTVENISPVSITENTFTNRTNATLHVPSGSRDTYVAASYWNEFKQIVEPDPKIGDRFTHPVSLGSGTVDMTFTVTSVAPKEVKVGTGANYANSIDKSSTGTLTIPSEVNGFSVTAIGTNAFYECSKITTISLPTTLTTIDNGAFATMTGLTSIIIPYGVTNIYDYAFNGCTALSTVSIPSSVSHLGGNAFNSCYHLTTIVIPESITILADNTFRNCEKLSTVTLPNGLTSIGRNAFFDCSSLTDITIPSSVTSIDYCAFSGCSRLTDINIPSSVTSIGEAAFYNCSGLTSVTVGMSIPISITENTFTNRTNATLHVPAGSKAAYTSANYWGQFKQIVDPSSIIAFADANVKAICVSNWDTSGDGELSIGEAAEVGDLGDLFRNNNSIKSFDELQYFTNLVSVGGFEGCSDLTSIVIPNSVTSIGGSAFEDCRSLTSISIPNSVKTIGNYAFSECRALASITIPNSVISIGDYAFEYCRSASITIPNSVTSIGNFTFSNLRNLTSVTIPKSVTSIGDGAFMNCSSLISIQVESGNTIYDSRNNCNGIIETSSNTLIAGSKNTVIPNSVTSIGNNAFLYCSELTSVTIPNSVTSIGQWAFSECNDLTSVTIPNSVTNIEKGAFNGCTSLTSVTIPNSVTFLGNSAFRNTSLESIEIPNNLQTIGTGTFDGCASLASISLPSSVVSIEKMAFSYCINLKDVYYYSESETNTNKDAFIGSNIENATLHIPQSCIDLYKDKKPWSSFKEIVEMGKQKCSTPTIHYVEGKLHFDCETDGVEYHYEIVNSSSGNDVSLIGSTTYQVSVFATKEGYENSETSTAELAIKNGDMNGDGVITVTDTILLLDEVLTKP